MVAKITVPQNIGRALNYNEQKVKEGMAQCIYAHNFLKDAAQLNFYEKLNRFEGLIALNKKASTNAVHISLNFAENENLSREQLVEIASVYMQKIGFDEQPYLVYQHLDAGHPHVHIVATNIQKDGKRISLHNLGKNQSNQARKEIEITYGLIKAEEQKREQSEKINPVNVQKVIYGKTPTKRAISNVLDAVLTRYKYSSLAELNAILKLYNVVADKGAQDSRIFKHSGLVYRVLDGNGNKVGVPIKASAIYNKPTLKFLEQKFKENEIVKELFKKQVKTSIDWVLLKQHKSIEAFQKTLAKEKITLVFRRNEQGIIYGLTYIDHNSRSVFNGSAIGKEYSAKAILGKCSVQQLNSGKQTVSQTTSDCKHKTIHIPEQNKEQTQNRSSALDLLISPIEQYQQLPYEFRKQKKKKKQKSSTN